MNDYGISLRQPLANDLIGSTVAIAALGTAFEASYEWKILNGGDVLADGYLTAGSMGTMSAFVHEAPVEGLSYTGPAVFQFAGDDPSGGEEGEVPPPIRVPVFVIPGAEGYIPYQIVAGDTLSRIVRERGSDVTTVENTAMFNDIRDPDKIRAGQIIRIPV